MNWETLYCPNPDCFCYGYHLYQGFMVKNGSVRGKKRALCKACGNNVALNYATAYYGLEGDYAIFEMAVRALAEGNSLRSTSRIVEIDKETIRKWLDRAAHHCRLIMLELWNNLHVTECQLDELWSFVHTKEGHLLTAKVFRETYGDAWVWLAFAPVWRLVLAFVVGKRNQENANLLLKRVHHVTNEHIPFFTSDQLPEYKTAILNTYGELYYPERNGNRGRFPKARLKPLPGLFYAQVVKTINRGTLSNMATKIIFGTHDDIVAQLESSPVSSSINTSFVERDNLTQRQSNRRLTRKSNGFSKEIEWFEKQLWLSLAYYHLALPHHSLRQKLSKPEPTKGNGSQKRWKPVTPAMAAGITDHVWTTKELLSFRTYPEKLIQFSKSGDLFPK